METTKLIGIYGMGGHGKVVAQIARAVGFETIVWIDDAAKEAVSFETFLTEHPASPIALGIGSNIARESVFNKMISAGIIPKTLIHPSAVIAEDTVIAEGCVVMPLVVINTETVIEAGVIINTNVVVEHECRIGRFSHISPKVGLAGAVSVGERTHIGIGSSVIQCLNIGSDTVVGAGAVVVTDLPDTVLAVGVPAVIKKELV